MGTNGLLQMVTRLIIDLVQEPDSLLLMLGSILDPVWK